MRVPVLGCIAEDFSNILPAPNLPPIFNTTSTFLKLGQSADVENEHIDSCEKGHSCAQQATIGLCQKFMTIPTPISVAINVSFLPFPPFIRCSRQSAL